VCLYDARPAGWTTGSSHWPAPPASGMSVKTISDRLAGHDLAVVIGAEVFRYYPYVPGDYLPAGTELLQITADPETAGAARVGDSLLGDPRTAIGLLLGMVTEGFSRTAPEPMARPRLLPPVSSRPLTAPEVYAVLSRVRPPDAVIVNESTSTMAQQVEWLPTVRTGSFFATASGGIGWGVPAAVGVALGDRDRGVSRPVLGLIGDGSFQYSVQALWTAAQHRLPIVYVVMRNDEYSILKSFAVLEDTLGFRAWACPGSALPTWRAGSAAARPTSGPPRSWSRSSRRPWARTPPRSSWSARSPRPRCCNDLRRGRRTGRPAARCRAGRRTGRSR
jgi:thiamine pyrophosphate-dependent acetolactate synthase large subunit-like protein